MKLKIFKFGTGLAANVPAAFAREKGLKPGDYLEIPDGARASDTASEEKPTASLFKSNDGLSPLQRALQGDVKPRMEWCDKHRGWKTNCGCK